MTGEALPEGFTLLETVDPTILSDLRYGGDWNFLGHPVPGYSTQSKVILTTEAAFALKAAQEHFRQDGYCLVVYDAYRPQKASDCFMEWRQNITDQKMKVEFYPRVDKVRIHELGYIAQRSGHTRGSAIDVTLIPWGQALQDIAVEKRTLQDGFDICYLNDGTLDMGSPFDLFDEASHYENTLISSAHMQNRQYLRKVMEGVGFEGYAKEWWHFSLPASAP